MILSCVALGPGRKATASLNGKREVRTHTQPYRVTCSSDFDTSYEVQAAFPPIGSPHPNDPYAFLISKDPDAHDKSKHVWIVPLVYSTDRPRDSNPEMDPVDIEWDTDTRMEPYQFDRDGQPLLNSAGDSYGDAIKEEKAYWTVTCTSNHFFIPQWIDRYKNAYNSDSCSIDGVFFDPGQCRVKKIHISHWQTREQYRYRVLTLTIKITDNPTVNLAAGPTQVPGWSKNVIDEGLRCLVDPFDDDEEILFPCTDDSGADVKKAAALDGAGHQLRGPDDYGPPTADQIVYNSFNLIKALPFSALPIN